MGLRPKQQAFLDEYLIDGNATRAYEKAYGKLDRAAASKLKNQPWVKEALGEIIPPPSPVTTAAIARAAHVAEIVKTFPVHRLEARQARIFELARIAAGEVSQTRTWVDKEGHEHTAEVLPTFTEQIKAYELLCKIHGDLVIQKNITVESKAVIVRIDNGRGPVPKGPVALLSSDTAEYEICSKCNEAIEKNFFGDHEKICPGA